jgi:hypothetical protein
MALWRFSNLNKYGNWRHRIVSWPDNKPFSHGPGFGRAVGVQRFKYEHTHAYIPPALLVSPKDGQKYILNTPFINSDKNSKFQYFVYICDENNEIKKINFNAKDS